MSLWIKFTDICNRFLFLGNFILFLNYEKNVVSNRSDAEIQDEGKTGILGGVIQNQPFSLSNSSAWHNSFSSSYWAEMTLVCCASKRLSGIVQKRYATRSQLKNAQWMLFASLTIFETMLTWTAFWYCFARFNISVTVFSFVWECSSKGFNVNPSVHFFLWRFINIF